MPSLLRELTFGAAGSNANVNAGSIFETASRRRVLSIGVVATVAANLAGINVGADVVAEEFVAPVLATYPIIPDNFYFTDVAEVNDRIVIFVRATVAVTYRTIVIMGDA